MIGIITKWSDIDNYCHQVLLYTGRWC